MSSWCCSTPCPPSPLPPVSVTNGNGKTSYPQVTAAPYAVMATSEENERDNGNSNAQWWGPVFLQHPGKCLEGNVTLLTLHLCDKDKTPISVYVLSNPLNQHIHAGLPVLSPRSCLMRVCTSSRDQIQRNREENIRINVQNGTWCKTPMSSSEFLEYSKAMNGVQYVYTASGCC